SNTGNTMEVGFDSDVAILNDDLSGNATLLYLYSPTFSIGACLKAKQSIFFGNRSFKKIIHSETQANSHWNLEVCHSP
ncbi:MAG: hypothetical protein AB2693_29780, partial [Candidatus Thiodiazotropha sp.]